MKAFVLAAGFGKRLEPLTNEIPKPMLPILNKPILLYILENLKNYNFSDIKINLHYLPEHIDSYLVDGSALNLNISYSLEKNILGTAGALARNPSFFSETILVQYGCCFADINFDELWKYHKQNNSDFTLVVKEINTFSPAHDLFFKSPGKVTKDTYNQNKKNTDLNFSPVGLFLIEKKLFDLIPTGRPSDILPELLEIALEANLNIFSYENKGSVYIINSMRDLLKSNQDLLSELALSSDQMTFIGKNSSIHKSVYSSIKHPVLLGDNVKIGKNVELKSPIIIGNNIRINSNVTIQNSLILNNSIIGKNVELSDVIVIKNLVYNLTSNFGVYIDDPLVIKQYSKAKFPDLLNFCLIRITEVIISLLALILLSPIFLIISILIKIDSKGSIFFNSKRVRNPESIQKSSTFYKYEPELEVVYYKFRTMYLGSEKVEEETNKDNIYKSGPYFKAKAEDPRITKIGKFLRKTSLDELPLLINVLKGDLSFVGIWGLPKKEIINLSDDGFKDNKIDLSETARLRFKGKLGLAGYWQSLGRSKLTAEERAIHDSIQSLNSIDDEIISKNLGEYKKSHTFKGYYSLILKTIKSVINKKGAI